MRQPSEGLVRKPGQRFMGRSVTGEPLYRYPRRGRSVEGSKPLRLDTPQEGINIPPNSDVFPRGVMYYDFPPTIRKLSWRGRILTEGQKLTRVLDDEGEHLRRTTDMGVFGLYAGIIDNPGNPKWLDPNRAVQRIDRRKTHK